MIQQGRGAHRAELRTSAERGHADRHRRGRPDGAVPRWRKAGLIATTAAIGFLAPFGWQVVLKATHSYEFYTDLPFPPVPISWQDTGSGVVTYAIRTFVLSYGPMRSQPARAVSNLALATGAVALVVDIYLY